jgi:hypothetical protein
MKRFRFAAMTMACLSAAFLMTTPAWAGSKTQSGVLIDDSQRLGSGALGAVRNTANLVEYIGCDVYNTFGICFATNSAGTSRSCFTYDANLINNMRSVTSDSLVLFYWDANGYCSQIIVENSSNWAPRIP